MSSRQRTISIQIYIYLIQIYVSSPNSRQQVVFSWKQREDRRKVKDATSDDATTMTNGTFVVDTTGNERKETLVHLSHGVPTKLYHCCLGDYCAPVLVCSMFYTWTSFSRDAAISSTR